MPRTLTLAVLLTFAFGFATAAAFFIVGGQVALSGPYVVSRSWPLIYALESSFVFGLMFAIGLIAGIRVTKRMAFAAVCLAWAGQFLVLASGLLASELTPLNSVGIWLLATAGPLQPIAAYVGFRFGRSRRYQSHEAVPPPVNVEE